VHVLGGFGNSLVNYQVSAINGAGYKTLSRGSNTIDLKDRNDVHLVKPVVLALAIRASSARAMTRSPSVLVQTSARNSRAASAGHRSV